MSSALQLDRPPRKASRAVRKRQLVEATIDSLSARGFAGTTMAQVTEGASLSRGIANFHFESKAKLLEATVQFLSEEYEDNWQDALENAGPTAAEKLWAIVDADFSPRVCNTRYIAAWAALRAEANARPSYQDLSGPADRRFESVLTGLCHEIIREGGYALSAERIARGLASLGDGLGFDLLIRPDEFSAEDARACVREHLIGLFPQHFSPAGPIGAG